ncbi:DNA-(apurinic or apyrimidinic site) lyase /endonuclease III [Fodinibius roseus]|uniref:Endonuclease III n=1 Tax=Fodinibius roseus TaxID=1194090 RepID=A0A1M5EEQ1_9BACT|nr:endonuclease III [Fodinibius roseus]SHF77676.1 DNA-(apurinic or apyrimidinic site) lyase /endonuclease III [Fodinibius roseus]
MPNVKLYDDLPKLPQKTEQEKARAREILNALYEHYPDPHCALVHRNAFELLCATILSAQCTDVRVNKVTPELFEAYPTPEAMAEAPIQELEELVRSTGFYRNKAKALKTSSQTIAEEHGGEVPQTMDELLELFGVARKTANVVLGNAFNINVGVVVDTHVRRFANRYGLTEEKKNTDKIERDLMALFPRTSWTDLSHLIIHHGRNACKARISEPPDHPVCKKYGINCKCRQMRKE